MTKTLGKTASTPLRQMLLFALDQAGEHKKQKRESYVRIKPCFDERLLQLPLFHLDSDPETVLADVVEIQTIGYIPETEDFDEVPYHWTNDGILQLHSVLLSESLAILAGKGNGTQKREVLEWIFEPDYVGEFIKNGVPSHLYTWETPWSFLFCCRLERMHKPEIIQDFIRRLLPEGSAIFMH